MYNIETGVARAYGSSSGVRLQRVYTQFLFKESMCDDLAPRNSFPVPS